MPDSPRVEAAARALREAEPGESYETVAGFVLAAADEAEPVESEAESGAAMAIAAGEIKEWRERADRAERAARELAEALRRIADGDTTKRVEDGEGTPLRKHLHREVARDALAAHPEYSKESGT